MLGRGKRFINERLADTRLNSIIAKTFPLEQVAQAHPTIRQNRGDCRIRAVGKVSDPRVGYKVFRENEARHRVRPLFNGLTGDAKRRRSRRPTMEGQYSRRPPRGHCGGSSENTER